MDFNDAIAAVEAGGGECAWWSGLNNGTAGSFIRDNPINLYGPGSPDPIGPYVPTPADQAATSWDTGDHPPK
jgi:hypothetical protein